MKDSITCVILAMLGCNAQASDGIERIDNTRVGAEDTTFGWWWH